MSTLATRSGRAGAATLALVTSFLVVLSGLFVAPAAYAEVMPTPAITVTPSENLDPAVDNVLTVSGTGFVGAGAAQGAYVLVGDKNIWSGVGPLISNGWIAQVFVRPATIVDGAFTTTLTIPANSLDSSKQYHVATSAAHELSETDRSLDTFADLSVAQPAPVAQATTTTLAASANAVEEGADLTFTATVAPVAEGTVSFTAGGSPLGAAQQVPAGVATLTTSALAVGTHQIEANFTPADAGLFTPSASAPVSVSVTAPQVSGPAETTLTVSTHASLVSDGHRIGLTAKLTSSVPNTGATALAIGEVQFFENGISLGAPVAAKLPMTNGSSVTVTNVSGPVAAGQDSVFTATFTPTEANAHKSAESAPATVAGTAATGPWDAKIEVFLKTGETLVPYTNQKLYKGDELVVRGTGFDPEANVGGRGVPVPIGPQGTYVVFGNFDATGWEPSTGAASSKRKATNQGWVLSESVLDTVPTAHQNTVRAQWTKPDGGAFEWSSGPLTTPADVTNGDFGIYTYAAGGATNADEELEVLVNYVDEVRPDSPDIELVVGGLDWAFNTGWNGYAKYVAQATITGANGATVDAAGLANYTQVAGGDYDAATGVGSIHYEGIVRYVSELHGFDIALKNPQINFTSKTAATLTAELSNSDVGGVSDMTRVTLAILTPGAPAGAAGEMLTWENVPGVFDDSIQPEGWADYAGKTIAPLAFTFGAEKPAEPEAPESVVGGLDWAFNTGWNGYAKYGAQATIEGANGATVDAAGLANYTQVKGGDFDAKTGLGSIHYQGTVSYKSSIHFFEIAIKDPQITFTSKTAATLTAEVSNTDTDGASNMTRITFANLTSAAFTEGTDGLLNWATVQGVFANPIQPAGWAQYAGTATAPLNFSYGAEKSDIPVDPVVPPTKPVTPTPTPGPAPVGASQQAGSLSWSISSGFATYTTGKISKGSVSTSGVGSSGGGYLFPQASGGSWNKATQTGSVQFSGVVTFSGHGGLMNEVFANPIITVTSATTGTLTAGGRTFGLNLGAAAKAVGANGEVTWSGVPVSGTISGGGSASGAAGSGSFSPDPLSFTVGAASGISYGSTTQTEQKAAREAAATAPATTGITVVTPKEGIVPGGEIEFSAEGFEASERDILVVLYSDPIVLDRKAGANADGKVTWIGTLPADLEPGNHTITLQGSKNVGAVIAVIDPEATVVTAEALASSSGEQGPEAITAGLNAGPVWLWWIGAGALVLLAGVTGGLVVVQRRRNSAV